MTRTNDIKTATYRVGIDNFMVDIVIHADGDIQYESWLYREDIGIKEYLYGCLRNVYTLHKFVKEVENYIITPNSYGMTELELYDENHPGV